MAVCPICSSTDFRPRRTAGTLTLGECRSCALAYADPLEPAVDETVAEAGSSITDSGYNDGMRWHFESRVDEARRLAANRLARYTDLLGHAPRELLEVGCGTGAFGPAYGELGIRWQGVELNPESVAFAREHALHVEQGDFLRYDGPPVDVVVASQVLEHVLAPRAFLRKVAAVLRPGGLLHLDVPNHGGLAARIRTLPGVGEGEFGFVQPPYHLLAYRRATMRTLLEDEGWRIEVLRAVGNDDHTYGQLTTGAMNGRQRLALLAAGRVGLGSLLVVVASRRGPD